MHIFTALTHIFASLTHIFAEKTAKREKKKCKIPPLLSGRLYASNSILGKDMVHNILNILL